MRIRIVVISPLGTFRSKFNEYTELELVNTKSALYTNDTLTHLSLIDEIGQTVIFRGQIIENSIIILEEENG